MATSSVSQIESEITTCVNSSDTLVLPGTALGSATMEAAFTTYLPNAELIVTNPSITSTSDAVVVTGLGGGLFGGLDVTATFTPTSDDISVVVSGTMTSAWYLSTAFPCLAPGTYAQLPFGAGGIVLLQTLPVGSVGAGLFLNGQMSVTGILTSVSPFLAGLVSIPISGPLTFVSQTLSGVVTQTPSFSFTCDVAQSMTVGTLTGDFTLSAICTPIEYSAYNQTTGQYVPTYTPDGYLSLSCAVSFSTNSGPVTYTATMRFSAGLVGSLTLSVAGNPGVSLDSFTSWAAGDLSLGLPDASLFDPSNYLTLNSVNFTIMLPTAALASFSVTVSTTETWVIVPDIITISDVSLVLTSVFLSGASGIIGELSGTVNLGSNPPVPILLSGGTPSYTFVGGLAEGTTVNLSSLIAYLIPAAVDIPQIDLEYFEFTCQADSTNPVYSLDACLSSDWTLAVGPASLSVTSAWVDVAYGAGANGASATTGSMGGTIVFNSDITFTVTYAIPGIFTVGGQIPQINLSALIAELVNIVMALPAGFDLSFTNCLIAICYSNGGEDLTFQVSANVSGLGEVAFEALEVNGKWGYATGVSMGNVGISAVPGLSALEPFDSYFAFQQLVLVVSTTDLPSFVFPVVPAPSGSTGVAPATPVVMPTSQSVVEGMNAYAQIDLNTQPDLQLLMQLLNMKATLSVTLTVGMSNVANDSMVSAGIAGDINSNTIVAGTFIASIVGDVVSLSVKGSLTTVIQGQQVIFSLLISFQPNGALLSGSYTGTIDFCIVSLSNLIIEIGVDFEEIPTVGFGAQINTATFESSVMILLDSVIPTQSMFVGSVSEMSLGTVVQNLCGVLEQQPPADLLATLNVVNISGTNPFSIVDASNSVSEALNNLDVATVSAAFATAGVALPSGQSQVMISVSSASTLWFVTDLVSLYYYKLSKSGSGQPIAGLLDPQLYVVPQTTQLGPSQVYEGFRLSGSLNLFGFSADLKVEILDQQGFSIDASFTPIIITVSNYPVFSLTGSATDMTSGASLSVCTYTDTATGETPHFDANGYVSVLGVLSAGVDIAFTETGGSFSMTANLSSIAVYTMTGSYSAAFTFSLSGSAVIGVNQTFNFGVLGNIDFDANVNYEFAVAVNSATSGSGSASGGFTFEVSFTIPAFPLPLNTTSLADIATNAADQVEAALQLFLDESANWLNWLGASIIQGITGGAEQVGDILGSYFATSYNDIATQTTDILNYTTDQVTQALQGAGATADETYDVLVNTLGATADEATSAVDSFFTGSSHLDIAHSDSTGGHVDTGHTDTVTDHVDNVHTDSTSDHVDDGHDDTNTDHVDSKMAHDDAHWDAWGSPHSHTDSASHDDTSLHTDIGHDDTSLHTDIIHDDTALHTDIIHDDTAAHFDTPHSDGPV